MTLRTLLVLSTCAAVLPWATAGAAAGDPHPASTRKIVLEKADQNYRWKLIEAPVPTPGDRQVLIRVRAVALNRGDLEVLDSVSDHDSSGQVVASDAAGDVVAVGKGVRDFRPGQRVTSLYFGNYVDGPPDSEKLSQTHGASVDGVLGDYIVLDDTAIAPMPQGLTYEQAAALPTAGLTAWMASAGRGPLGRNDIVVVQGTGGVSIFALQFASASGARVIVTSSSDDKLQRVKQLGASDGINYRSTPAWSDRVMALTDGRGASLIVDVGGKSTLEQSVKSLAYQGTVSIVGGLTGYDGSLPAAGLLLKVATARGVYVGSRADFLRMSDFIEKHKIRPVIDRVFPFEQHAAALEYLSAGNFVGKVVLTFAGKP